MRTWRVLAVVLAMVGCATVGLATTMQFENNAAPYVVDSSGNNVPTSDLLMFVNAGANGVADPASGTTGVSGDDSVLGSGTASYWAAPGYYSGVFVYDEGATFPVTLTYFGRVFDASTVAASANYVDLGIATATWTDGMTIPATYDSDTQPMSGSYGWQPIPVPEPSTMALAGLGLVVAAARRRFGKK